MMEWASPRNLARLIIDGRLDEMKTLLKYNSPKSLRKIVSKKEQHNSLLFLAVKYRRLSIVDYLLRTCRADPNDDGLDNDASCPCLVLAAEQNDMEIVTELVRYGADVNGADIYRQTALYQASSNDNYIMVRYLIANGADVNKVDYKGTSCLMIAPTNWQIISYLIQNGANPNLANYNGKTALMLAVRIQDKSRISMLLSFGVDVLFRNDYGESALFFAIMAKRWDIVAMLRSNDSQFIDTTVAEVCEIKSCRHLIRRELTDTILLWRKAMALRRLPKFIPIFSIESPFVIPDGFDWVQDCFDYITGCAIVFLVSRFGLLNPYSLAFMRDAICQIEDLDVFVIPYRIFLQSLRGATNRLFEKAFADIYLMTSYFLQELGNDLEAVEILFKVLVDHIENFFQRIASKSNDSYPLVFQIHYYLRLFINVLVRIHDYLPESFTSFTDGIKTIVQADKAGPHQFSLLHLCVKYEYPECIPHAFLVCGADPMCVDERGKTTVHYMVESFTYQNKEIFNTFMKHGFRPENFKDGQCLCCSLRKSRMLQYPMNYITLKCLAAEAVNKHQLSYEDRLSTSHQNLIYSHSKTRAFSRFSTRS